jgi:aryl-alcohol dehydrogenase-like predicted oxidoreductase/predicted kinase
MRLSPDEETAAATVAAALEAGITVFDTARSYDGSEALLARLLRGTDARIVTKGGMARPDEAWIPDGRARAIRADCEASVLALGGLPVDLYLLHAPDPRVPWATSVRALAKLVEDGLVARVGVCNVTRGQLDEAAALAPLAAVQVAVGVLDDRALRRGVVERAAELGIALVAHSPLGGPRRAGRLGRDATLAEVARAHDATPAEVALAWVLGLGPNVVAIPGATRPETARSAAHAASLRLTADEQRLLGRHRPRAVTARRDGDVVVVMGIPGAGKSRIAAEYVERGYLRLNRDERGGTLRGIAQALDEALASGAREVVLDNTYVTRTTRSYVVDAAARHGLAARCVWIDVALADAQVNLVGRLVERFGSLPAPDELKRLAKTEPGVLTPTQQMRAFRELEPPEDDEGFASIERTAFVRRPRDGRAGVLVAAAAVERLPLDELDPSAPVLVFDWRPDGHSAELEPLAALLPVPAATAVCPHGAGPPTCWCRPPLPGLPLAFAHRHGVAPASSLLVGTSAAHRALAAALGTRFLSVS